MYLSLKVNSDSKPRIKCMGDLNPESLQTDIYIINLQATEGDENEKQTSGFCTSFFRLETGLHCQGIVE